MRLSAAAASFAALLPALAPAPGLAGPAVDAMANCLVGNTSADDRVVLMRWMILSFAAHPVAGEGITMPEGAVDQVSQQVAAMFTTLLTQTCVAETKAAFAAEGAVAFEGAFGVLGQVAAQDLSMSPEVNGVMIDFMRYIDQSALDAALQ